jgi:transketolase N-terminal domain/subunit
MTQTIPVLDLAALEDKAVEVRLDILDSTTRAGSGHPSSSFSAVEAVLALYFGGVLRYRPDEPDWPTPGTSIAPSCNGCARWIAPCRAIPSWA